MVQKSGVHQLRLVSIFIPLFTGFYDHPKWLALGFLNHQQYLVILGIMINICITVSLLTSQYHKSTNSAYLQGSLNGNLFFFGGGIKLYDKIYGSLRCFSLFGLVIYGPCIFARRAWREQHDKGCRPPSTYSNAQARGCFSLPLQSQCLGAPWLVWGWQTVGDLSQQLTAHKSKGWCTAWWLLWLFWNGVGKCFSLCTNRRRWPQSRGTLGVHPVSPWWVNVLQVPTSLSTPLGTQLIVKLRRFSKRWPTKRYIYFRIVQVNGTYIMIKFTLIPVEAISKVSKFFHKCHVYVVSCRSFDEPRCVHPIRGLNCRGFFTTSRL